MPEAPPGSSSPLPRGLARVAANWKRLAVYFGAATLAVTAWIKLRDATTGLPAGTDGWTLAIVSLLPLLYMLAETWLRCRCRHRVAGRSLTGWFDLAPRTGPLPGKEAFTLPDDAHLKVPAWVRRRPAPILHLIGRSGTGKSSLLTAALLPALKEDTTILLLRVFGDDPLRPLREALLRPGNIWVTPPDDLPALDPIALLERAGKAVKQKGHRLLLLFDQFEEFAILHPGKDPAASPLAGFLRSLATAPDHLTVLLAWREDYQSDIQRLGLPPLHQDTNYYRLRPFTTEEAETFLNGSGLTIEAPHMRAILAEAAGYEESGRHIRPIIANFLGLVLSESSGHPKITRHTRFLLDFVRSRLRDTGLEPRQARALLDPLLSPANTVRPATESELHAAVPPAQSGPALLRLEHAGLTRCLTPGESDPARRTWQLSHDFVARLCATVREGLFKGFWRTLHPWVAPALLLLITGLLFLGWPWYQRERALGVLLRHGFSCDESNWAFSMGEKVATEHPELLVELHPVQSFKPLPSEVIAALRIVKPRGLKLYRVGWASLFRPPGGSSGFEHLERLDLRGDDVQSFPALAGLPALQYLSLNDCPSLTALPALAGLPQLQGLDLSGCTGLTALPELAGLPQLQHLDLRGCTGLKGKPQVREGCEVIGP